MRRRQRSLRPLGRWVLCSRSSRRSAMSRLSSYLCVACRRACVQRSFSMVCDRDLLGPVTVELVLSEWALHLAHDSEMLDVQLTRDTATIHTERRPHATTQKEQGPRTGTRETGPGHARHERRHRHNSLVVRAARCSPLPSPLPTLALTRRHARSAARCGAPRRAGSAEAAA